MDSDSNQQPGTDPAQADNNAQQNPPQLASDGAQALPEGEDILSQQQTAQPQQPTQDFQIPQTSPQQSPPQTPPQSPTPSEPEQVTATVEPADASQQQSPAPVIVQPPPVVVKPPAQDPVTANEPAQPAQKHEQPIFMQEDGPTSSSPPTVSSTPAPSSVDTVPPSPPPMQQAQTEQQQPAPDSNVLPQQPSTQQPLQRPIQPASTVSQVAIPKRKKKSRFRLIILLLLGFIVAGLLVWGVVALFGGDSGSGQTNTTQEDNVSTREYESTLLGFSTEIPKDWEDVQRQEDGFDVVEFTHPEARSNGTALASVLLIRLRELTTEDKTDFFSTYEEALSGGFDEFNETANEEITIDGLPAKKIEADVTQEGEADKAIFYLVYAGENGFSIAQTADSEQFSELEEDLGIIITNFKSQIEAANSSE